MNVPLVFSKPCLIQLKMYNTHQSFQICIEIKKVGSGPFLSHYNFENDSLRIIHGYS
jgi:hypothetical protein